MAPPNVGGRPKLEWTAARNRKIIRLYLLTDITPKEIERIFKEVDTDGFTPRSLHHDAIFQIPVDILPVPEVYWPKSAVYYPTMRSTGVYIDPMGHPK